jgi:hypothetical protein
MHVEQVAQLPMDSGQIIERDATFPVNSEAKDPPASFRSKLYSPNFKTFFLSQRGSNKLDLPDNVLDRKLHSGKKKWAIRPLFLSPLCRLDDIRSACKGEDN